MFNLGFVIEQWMGHGTHQKNLARWVEEDQEIIPTWMPVQASQNDIWEHLPIIRSNGAIKFSLRARNAIELALRTRPLDALFLHTQMVALFAIPLMRRIPTIVSLDATPINFDSLSAGYDHKVSGNPLVEQQKFQLYKSVFKTATNLVTWSQWVKDSLVNEYDISVEKIIVLPPGIDTEQWNFKRDKTANNERLRLLFVASDFARKGGYTLLEAFHKGLNQQCTLDIVTKETHMQHELAGIEGVRVHCGLSANSPPLKELFSQADIFVFPTQADTSPVSVLEAMAAGLPIVATDVGALHEQVEDGVNGFLVPPSDAAAIASAVRVLCNDETKRRAMGAASRRIVEQRFDARHNYGELLNLMKRVKQCQLSL